MHLSARFSLTNSLRAITGEEEDPDVDDAPSTGGQHAAAAAATAPAAVEPDPAIVAQLMSMGFGENGSKRAAIATQVGCLSP